MIIIIGHSEIAEKLALALTKENIKFKVISSVENSNINQTF